MTFKYKAHLLMAMIILFFQITSQSIMAMEREVISTSVDSMPLPDVNARFEFLAAAINYDDRAGKKLFELHLQKEMNRKVLFHQNNQGESLLHLAIQGNAYDTSRISWLLKRVYDLAGRSKGLRNQDGTSTGNGMFMVHRFVELKTINDKTVLDYIEKCDGLSTQNKILFGKMLKNVDQMRNQIQFLEQKIVVFERFEALKRAVRTGNKKEFKRLLSTSNIPFDHFFVFFFRNEEGKTPFMVTVEEDIDEKLSFVVYLLTALCQKEFRNPDNHAANLILMQRILSLQTADKSDTAYTLAEKRFANRDDVLSSQLLDILSSSEKTLAAVEAFKAAGAVEAFEDAENDDDHFENEEIGQLTESFRTHLRMLPQGPYRSSTGSALKNESSSSSVSRTLPDTSAGDTPLDPESASTTGSPTTKKKVTFSPGLTSQ